MANEKAHIIEVSDLFSKDPEDLLKQPEDIDKLVVYMRQKRQELADQEAGATKKRAPAKKKKNLADERVVDVGDD